MRYVLWSIFTEYVVSVYIPVIKAISAYCTGVLGKCFILQQLYTSSVCQYVEIRLKDEHALLERILLTKCTATILSNRVGLFYGIAFMVMKSLWYFVT